MPGGKSFQSRYHILDQHRDQYPHWQCSGEPPVHVALVIAASPRCFQSTDESWRGYPIELCGAFAADQSAGHATMPDVPLSNLYPVLP